MKSTDDPTPSGLPLGEIRPMDDPVVVADEKAHPGAWTPLTDNEYRVLMREPKPNRMFKLRTLRPELTFFQRKQALKQRGLR